MARLFGFVAAAFAILAFLAVAMMFYGAATSAGMVIVAFQLWAMIAGGAAIVLGIVSRLLGRESGDGMGAAHFGIGLGLGSLLAMLIAIIFFS